MLPDHPILDLEPEIEALWDEITAAVHRVLRSGQFILGPEVAAFEEEVAATLGTRHAVGLNSGTDALVIGLRALGVGPGDEVIVPTFTFFATAEAVSVLGATPVFVDVDLETYTLDVAQVEAAVTERTRAVIPVHLFGRPVDMAALQTVAERHGLALLEDCAQSFGAMFGGQQDGHARPGRRLLVLPDQEPRRLRRRRPARDRRRRPRRRRAPAPLARLPEEVPQRDRRLQLPPRRDPGGHPARQAPARRRVQRARAVGSPGATTRRSTGLDGLVTPEIGDGHVVHQYTVRVLEGRRDAVRAALAERGIGTMVYYPVPCHRLPIYDAPAGSLPVSERLADEVLSLPIWPQMGEEAQEAVATALREALG